MGVRLERHELDDILSQPGYAVNGADNKEPPKPPNTALANLPLGPESEEQYQTWQIRILHENGWRVHAERPALTRRGKWLTPVQGDPGFFDVVALHPKTDFILLIENKSHAGRLSPDQEKWALIANRLESVKVLISRPDDRAEFLKIAERRA